MNAPALSYRRLREFAGPAANPANVRCVSVWPPVGAGASQAEFTSDPRRSPAGLTADLVYLAKL
jgi:hypothetical protein